jgi:hypothetical protein
MMIMPISMASIISTSEKPVSLVGAGMRVF